MSDIFARAQAFEGQGQLADALVEYGRLIDAGQGGSDALGRRAMLHSQMGRFPEMTADFERALKVGPTDPYPAMWQGHIAKGMARMHFAAACLETALDRAQGGVELEMRINLCDIYMLLGWLDRAAEMARHLPIDAPDWWGATRRTATTRHQERRAETRALLARRTIAELSREEWLTLAEHLFSIGRLAAATAVCEALMRAEPHDFAPFRLRARCVARSSGAEAAIAFYQSVAWLHGRTRDWAVAVGWLLHDLGQFDAAIAGLRGFGAEHDQELMFLSGLAHSCLGDAARLGLMCREWMLAVTGSVPAAGLVIAAFAASTDDAAPRRPLPSPQRLHMVHFWNNPDVPSDILETIGSWRRHNPGLETTVFSAPAAADFIRHRLGSEVSAAFALCRHPAMQADLFRVAFLAEAGGLYADADELCLGPMPELMARMADAELAAVRSGDIPGFLHNYFMGARADSPTMASAVRMAAAGVLGAAQLQVPVDIWHTTGPGLVTRAAGLALAERPDSITRDDILLIPLQQYRALTRTEEDLAYKRQAVGNWRLS